MTNGCDRVESGGYCEAAQKTQGASRPVLARLCFPTTYEKSQHTMRSLPERTVDAWVASAITGRFPNARIWAPTQRAMHVDNNWDYGVGLGQGKIFILEDKATEWSVGAAAAGGRHTIVIDLPQLDWYCLMVEPTHRVPVYYVLPVPPWNGEPAGVVPPESAHRTAPPFEGWTVAVRCHLLRAHIAAPAHQMSRTLRAADVPAIPGGETLGDFLDQVLTCERGARTPLQEERDNDLIPVDNEQVQSARPLAVFISAADLPNF